MENVIESIFGEYCDIDSKAIHALSKTLACRLKPYVKIRPSLKQIAYSKVYKALNRYGTILNMCTNDTHGVLQFASCTDFDKVMALSGSLYSSEIYYPMDLKLERFGPDMVLLTLVDHVV